jgi:hypothetical protein
VECIACKTCCIKRTLVERLMIALAAKSALSAMTRTANDNQTQLDIHTSKTEGSDRRWAAL